MSAEIITFRSRIYSATSDEKMKLQLSLDVLELEDEIEDLKQTIFGLCYAIDSTLENLPEARRAMFSRIAENARKRVMRAAE